MAAIPPHVDQDDIAIGRDPYREEPSLSQSCRSTDLQAIGSHGPSRRRLIMPEWSRGLESPESSSTSGPSGPLHDNPEHTSRLRAWPTFTCVTLDTTCEDSIRRSVPTSQSALFSSCASQLLHASRCSILSVFPSRCVDPMGACNCRTILLRRVKTFVVDGHRAWDLRCSLISRLTHYATLTNDYEV